MSARASRAVARVSHGSHGAAVSPRALSPPSPLPPPRRQVQLPVSSTLYDIAFDTADHGYVVGAKGTFLETNNGGKTWEARSFSNLDATEEINYRFEKVSFKDNEGWVIGKPAILLHTADGGKTWERVPLSPKLPGEPSSVKAFGANKAEMTTTAGAVYVTTNAGRNWKAQVKETIDATLNRISSSGVSGASYFTGNIISVVRDVSGARRAPRRRARARPQPACPPARARGLFALFERDPSHATLRSLSASAGSYLAISSRGNFYLTWSPGQDFWVPHNRGTPRRIQNMGFINNDQKQGLWMTLNGGQMALAKSADLSAETPPFEPVKINSGGYGLIDVAYRDEKEAWACGGGGTLFKSVDGGQTWKFNNAADAIPGNLYQIEFFGPQTGFALGSDGVLLRYTGRA